MKKRAIYLFVISFLSILLVTSLNAFDGMKSGKYYYEGSGADCLGTSGYEFKLNIMRAGNNLFGTLYMSDGDPGITDGWKRILNGKIYQNTLSFTVFTDGFQFNFVLLENDIYLNGGVVEFDLNGEDLSALTEVNFSLVDSETIELGSQSD